GKCLAHGSPALGAGLRWNRGSSRPRGSRRFHPGVDPGLRRATHPADHVEPGARRPHRGELEAKMKYERKDVGDETTLSIEGTLDAVTAPELRGVVDQLVNEQRKSVTLDLSTLRLIDSSGVGVIVALFKRVRANGGTVRIVGL